MHLPFQSKKNILILCIFFIISTGCLTQQDSGAGKPETYPTQTPVQVTPATIQSTSTPNQSLCPPINNETLWIRINPIPPQYDGENFTISGTTNMEAGKEIMVEASPYSGTSESAKSTAIWTYFPSQTTIVFDSCGHNQWSMNINTLSYSHKYGVKPVNVWAVNNESVRDATQFILNAGPRP